MAKKRFEANNETIRSQGVDISMIGAHSFRGGVAIFLSGTPGGPTAIAIYLRAGWSLGPVQSRYILEGEGGDQMVVGLRQGYQLQMSRLQIFQPIF